MSTARRLDVAAVRKDFPILEREVHGQRLIYLDSASSSQKPQQVLDAMDALYSSSYANVHRGVYQIAEEATAAVEGARRIVQRFINAPSEREVIFTKNVTEAINLVAYSWGRRNLDRGDVVVLTDMEHHANIVPWLMLADERGIELRWIPVGPDGRLVLDDLDELLTGAKLLAIAAVSNVLGTINPVRKLADAAQAAGALVLVDGAQHSPHLATDVQALGADFYGFTGHKCLGPTGIGVLWAREELLEAMPPFLGGGEMIRDVRRDGFDTTELPWKFEAGTPPIAEIVGLGAAIEYLTGLDLALVRDHEKTLTSYALEAMSRRYGDDVRLFGPPEAEDRSGVMSFEVRGVHPHDLSQILDQEGICVRAGHHCAKPLMRVLGVGATTRASFYVYNDEADVDALVDAIAKATELFW